MRAVRPLPLRVLSSSRTRGLSSRAPPAASASLPPQSAVRRIREQLRSGEATAVALASAALERIAATDGALNAFVSTQREQALEAAAALDERHAAGGALPPLAGVPVGVKDNLVTRGVATTAGSRLLEGHLPAYDATAVARMRAAGALLVGKCNMDEFGMGSSTESSAWGPTSNPWDAGRVPGGSSGGSAAAVAADQVPIALGSDTGGSVRQPAALCGVVGLKPTYGRVSRNGLIAYASSLDCVGPIAGCVEDAAHCLTAIAGADAADATCSNSEAPDFAAALPDASSLDDRPLAGKRIGLVTECMSEGLGEEQREAVARAVDALRALGAEVDECGVPSLSAGLKAYYVIATSEASSNLARYDGVTCAVAAEGAAEMDAVTALKAARGEGFGDEVRQRVLAGTYALSAGAIDAYYKRAQRVRTLVQRDFAAALAGRDALLMPAAVGTPAMGELKSDPLVAYAGDVTTVNVNMAGLPAISLPAPGAPVGALPAGVQLVGGAFGELELLCMAHVLEQCGGFYYAGEGMAVPHETAAV